MAVVEDEDGGARQHLGVAGLGQRLDAGIEGGKVGKAVARKHEGPLRLAAGRWRTERAAGVILRCEKLYSQILQITLIVLDHEGCDDDLLCCYVDVGLQQIDELLQLLGLVAVVDEQQPLFRCIGRCPKQMGSTQLRRSLDTAFRGAAR